MNRAKAILIWAGVTAAIALPVAIAAGSPLLQWRQPVYISAGFAGIAAMSTLLLQPLLVGGYLPGLSGRRGRRAHRAVGAIIILAVVVHVGGLWMTSPPDMIDALTFSAPTAFSTFGVLSMWLLFAAACLALLRQRLRAKTWRAGHAACVSLAVVTAAVHAMLIEGTMGTFSKAALCLFVLMATVKLMADLRIWRSFWRQGI